MLFAENNLDIAVEIQPGEGFGEKDKTFIAC